MKTVRVESPCPMCRETGALQLLTMQIDIPYFGEGLESTLRCGACGFRHADFMILGQKEPLHLELKGQGDEAMQVRVIRSNSGTVRIPELGFTAEPSQLSESYVSNVEGVLERAKGILLTALDWHKEDAQKAALLHGYLDTLDRMVRGDAPFTLVIDDPFGNSAIVSEAVSRRPLTQDELARLKTGMTVIDLADLEPDALRG